MKNHIAFFIICAAWDHLVEGTDFDRGDLAALEILSQLKMDIIDDPSADQSRLRTIMEALSWKHAMHADVEACSPWREVAA